MKIKISSDDKHFLNLILFLGTSSFIAILYNGSVGVIMMLFGITSVLHDVGYDMLYELKSRRCKK